MGSKGSANRQRIVEAADHLFYSRGYNQTSFSDISDQTGIPRGNFYYYFKTKEDILSAVVDARLAEFTAMLRQCEAMSDQPLERLMGFIQFPVQKQAEVLHYGCPIGSLSAELVKDQDTEIAPARLTAVFDLLKEWIQQQLSQLGKAEASEQIAMDLLARMQGVIILANVYNDAAFLQRGIKDIENWLSQCVSS